ncbi:CLIP domain-containing serine protease HP8-like [Temnothorax nylanderi]|uniref:CLIP domain-containing serine protease HP8-like n=1 Tax=Temnothorax nylanderi TaxID=102681 RepID=UPI003A886E0A
MSSSTFLVFLKSLALLIVGIYAQYQSSRTDCRVNGQVGACIIARDCAMVSNILQQSREQAIDYLRRNHCGFEGSNPLVCCIDSASIDTRPGGLVTNPGTTQGWNLEPTTPQSDENTQIDLANNPLLPNDCGRDLSQRIVGGERTELSEFPWMALLEYQKPNGRATACGGVLINKRYVLTAAHCIKGKDLPVNWRLTSVRLGEYDTDAERDCVPDGDDSVVCADDPVTVGVEEQIAHEEYRPLSRDQRYDIALLRLSRDVTFTTFIKPICLPSSSSLGGKLYVAGWGKTETRSASNIKLKLALPLADKDQCEQTYTNAGVQLGYGQICAGGQRGKDSCRGDSGGPLMAVERIADGTGRWTAVGVVSFGPSPCGMQGWPGIYTKVTDFVPWIVSKLRP